MEIKQGAKVAVVGSIGSGTSSFLAAILGQMKLESGTALVSQKYSLVPQDPWILNTTIKENILMGTPFDEKKYNAIIKATEIDKSLEGINQRSSQ